ncbi:unnamed protein product [Scytosiphon promiscuus]
MIRARGVMKTRTALVMVLSSSASTAARAFCAAAGTSPPVEANGARTKADDWDADRYSTNAGFVPELGKHVLELLAPRHGECILDVGCGDGVLTAELKARGCKVVGIDFSPDMIAAAVKKDVEAYVMDASAINAPFLLNKLASQRAPPSTPPATATATATATASAESGGENNADPPQVAAAAAAAAAASNAAFDAVFTNAALHWVRAPRTVIEGAKRVLRPGGRFVGEFGGHGNMAAVRVAMHAALWRRGVDPLKVDPWYFPTPHEYRQLLEAAGFIVDDVWLVPRPTVLPAGTGMRGWLSTFTQAFLNAIPEESSSDGETDGNGLTKAKAVVVDEALAALQPALRDKDGIWTADYVRLRFKAHLPHDSASGTAVDGGGGAAGFTSSSAGMAAAAAAAVPEAEMQPAA